MYALEAAIAQHVEQALQGQAASWRVFADASTPGRRDVPPMAIVALQPGGVTAQGLGAVQIGPRVLVQLVARRGPDAIALLDAALQAVCASLQGLAVGEQAGRKWERLQMQQFNTPLHEDEGLVCAELVFSTSARYMGNPQAQ